jgi:hypothetical protein
LIFDAKSARVSRPYGWSAFTIGYDLATKARKALPDAPELAERLGRLSYEKKEYPRAIPVATRERSEKGARRRFLV